MTENKLTAEQYIEKCKTSSKYFIQNALSITDKGGRLVPFHFNRAQKFHEERTTRFDYVIKARKLGFSSKRIAQDIWACAFQKNQHAIILTHTDDGALKMREERIRPLIKSSIINLGAKIKNDVVEFPATNSYYYFGTAGSRQFGRGSDITRYHLSEFAHWENPDVITGVEEGCTDNATGLIETTANGVNFAKILWDQSVIGQTRYKPIFIPWFLDDGYSLPGTGITNIDDPERKLLEAYNISHDQLAWRREKIRTMSKPELFPQEYPAYAEEAFLSSGRMVFDWSCLVAHEKFCREPRLTGLLRDDGEQIKLLVGA